MLESNLEAGAQSMPAGGTLADLKKGVSLTDACVGWEETVKLLGDLNEAVLKRRATKA